MELQRNNLKRVRFAFGLLELIVVICIITILLALLLSAIQNVRATAARLRCQSQLRQVGLALHHFHDTNNVFPSNGGWDGTQMLKSVDGSWFFPATYDTASGLIFRYGSGQARLSPHMQTGSWLYSILPFLVQEATYRQENGANPIGGLICPSRRLPAATKAIQDEFGQYSSGGWAWAKTDYAANAQAIGNRPLCHTLASFTDGTSSTILAGEKAMRPQEYNSGTWYWDEPYILGGSGGTVRGFGGNVGLNVLRDSSDMGMKFRYAWGANHPGGVVFLFADGSARALSFVTSPQIMSAFLSLAGHEVISD